MHYWLVMPAAGVGRRFGESIPKQYSNLQGQTVIEWSLAPFLLDSRCVGAVAVVNPADSHWPAIEERLAKRSLGEHTPYGNAAQPPLIRAIGGAERSHSVRNGLHALTGQATADDWVLVHDAARPCLSRKDLDRLVESLQYHPVGGVLAAPATDTLKRLGDAREILDTVDRTGLWRALTPQMFRYAKLCSALDRALGQGHLPTDEAQALEWSGERPLVVQGSAANIKITNADDLLVAAALLSLQGGREKD